MMQACFEQTRLQQHVNLRQHRKTTRALCCCWCSLWRRRRSSTKGCSRGFLANVDQLLSDDDRLPAKADCDNSCGRPDEAFNEDGAPVESVGDIGDIESAEHDVGSLKLTSDGQTLDHLSHRESDDDSDTSSSPVLFNSEQRTAGTCQTFSATDSISAAPSTSHSSGESQDKRPRTMVTVGSSSTLEPTSTCSFSLFVSTSFSQKQNIS